ncbi:MAG: hypothetical protein A3F74_10100 [Betaproteobacteria bacterium RIFCSPLOWO2_12_FULL_62_58]|nr:MAG: hypothetical protein A3F74_10100 [Betaproteobacteria bacterium RIFCSPLOWO2_12_FULL_62_58]
MAGEKVTVVRVGRLVDGNSAQPIDNALIVIEGGRFSKVGPYNQISFAPGAEVIDAGDLTAMPGMFDCHVHIAHWNALTFSNYRVAFWEVPPELQQFYALFHAQLTFEMGFTTLRDMGRVNSHGQLVAGLVAVRNAINAGIVAGPRLLVCGISAITGGHSDMKMARYAERHHSTWADGPWDLRRLTRENLRSGVDWIKTDVSGGGGTANERPDVRTITQEELDAIVDEAHAFHKPVAVHCFTVEGQKMCVKAKVDTIEHMVFSTEESIAMVAESGIPVTPTLVHRSDYGIEVRKSRGGPENVSTKMKKLQPICYETFQKMHAAKVKIAMGTDLGVDPQVGDNAYELDLYVRLGMSPMDALKTATKNAAEALGLGKDLGTIEAGKLADLVIVKGNPVHDISLLRKKENIQLVMKEGRVYVDKISAKPKYVVHPEPGECKPIDRL